MEVHEEKQNEPCRLVTIAKKLGLKIDDLEIIGEREKPLTVID